VNPPIFLAKRVGCHVCFSLSLWWVIFEQISAVCPACLEMFGLSTLEISVCYYLYAVSSLPMLYFNGKHKIQEKKSAVSHKLVNAAMFRH
jgi:hypothetical protein